MLSIPQGKMFRSSSHSRQPGTKYGWASSSLLLLLLALNIFVGFLYFQETNQGCPKVSLEAIASQPQKSCPDPVVCPSPPVSVAVVDSTSSTTITPAADNAAAVVPAYEPHPVPSVYVNRSSSEAIEDQVTICIKTFERFDCLNRLIDSIRKFYPKMRIVIADDSRPDVRNAQILRTDVDYYFLPFDSGLSAGRNVMMAAVDTPFFLLLDDDFVFSENTKIENLLWAAQHGNGDIVGGIVSNRKTNFGILKIQHGILRKIPKTDRGKIGACSYVDMVTNFFLGRKSAILGIGGWDNMLKMGEHEDFFLRARSHALKVIMCTEVKIDHQPEKSEGYMGFRERARDFIKLALMKHNIVAAYDWKNNIIAGIQKPGEPPLPSTLPRAHQ